MWRGKKNIRDTRHTFPFPTKVASNLPSQGHGGNGAARTERLLFRRTRVCAGRSRSGDPAGRGAGTAGRPGKPQVRRGTGTEARGAGGGGPGAAQRSRRPRKVHTHSVSQLRRPRRPPGRGAGDTAAPVPAAQPRAPCSAGRRAPRTGRRPGRPLRAPPGGAG